MGGGGALSRKLSRKEGTRILRGLVVCFDGIKVNSSKRYTPRNRDTSSYKDAIPFLPPTSASRRSFSSRSLSMCMGRSSTLSWKGSEGSEYLPSVSLRILPRLISMAT